jgi:hypothetical protein
MTVLDLDSPEEPPDMILVRPDQHVSWRGSTTGDPDAVIRAVVSAGKP